MSSLKSTAKNQQQEATIARLEKQIEVLAEGLQKVSAELESTDHAQQVAFNR